MTRSEVFATLSAAAQRFIQRTNLRRGRSGGSQAGSWQTEAWAMYQTTPEVRYAATWVSNAMSGCVLYAAKRGPNGEIVRAPDNSLAAEIVSGMAGGPDGQSSMLAAFGLHLTVPGEGWIVIVPDPNAQSWADHRWYVVSTQEVKQGQDKLTAEIDGDEVEVPAGDAESIDPTAPLAIRVWNPAPWRYMEADSPVRSSLVILQELQILNAAVAAIARSRIVGRGVMFVPQGTAVPGAAGQVDGSTLLDLFVEAASTAIREPESAAATVPIILEVPRDMIGQIQYMNFESPFDELAIKLREECIRRFATAVDTPSEIMMGVTNMSHWGVWAVQAEAVRQAAEPKLREVCQALTDAYLRPLLEREKEADANEWMVWFDTSPIRTSTNKGALALEAYSAGLISAEAARRETGFDEDDAPDAAPHRSPDDLPAETEPDVPVAETQSAPSTFPDNGESE